ncbi:MAG TPA: hypothetical protein VFU74_12340 [Actinocrinis sp.]|nr:hypothetical protein [Actinocrinis sp.]
MLLYFVIVPRVAGLLHLVERDQAASGRNCPLPAGLTRRFGPEPGR